MDGEQWQHGAGAGWEVGLHVALAQGRQLGRVSGTHGEGSDMNTCTNKNDGVFMCIYTI